RRWCVDNRCVNNGATFHYVTAILEAAINCIKKSLAKSAFLDQVPEVKQRNGIRHLLCHEIYTHELTHGIAVIDGILDTLI
ncbi:MAG: hypothetical protein PWP48_1501, partial [Clostridiales bacterium]|nr:hypothetical protein [Clostridiales bacterium]